MTLPTVLAPVFVQVALTFALLFWMGRTRFAAVRAGEVRVADVSLGQRAWPERAAQAGNSFHNQFELPVLFYALVAFAIPTRGTDLLFVVLSWVYVLTRIVHAAVYVTSNDIRLRFTAFLVGALALMLMWILFAAHILFGR